MRHELAIGRLRVDSAEEAARSEQAILAEIERLLARFLATGEPGAIDLRHESRRRAGADPARLIERLGSGEVTATIGGFGRVEVVETTYAGVWLLSYFDAAGELETRQIEIGAVPSLIAAQRDDARRGLLRLRAELATEPEIRPTADRPTTTRLEGADA